jgi:DNA polymerase I
MAYYPNIADWPYVVYDTETTGLQWWKDKVFGFSLTAPDDSTFYYDIRVDRKALEFARREIPKVKQLVCHNAKFDWHMSRESGIMFPEGRVFCTMIAAAIINEHEYEYGLDHLAAKYTDRRKNIEIYQKLADIFGGKPTAAAQAPNFHRAPVELMGPYAGDDTLAAKGLYVYELEEIKKQGIEKIINLEMQLLPAIVRMEWRGVPVDLDKANDASKAISKQLPSLQRELNKVAGFEVNPNPSGSIHELFKPKKVDGHWELIDGTVAASTEAGKASIDADTLRAMKHPAAAMILRLRKMKKVKDTFLEGHILGHHHNGVIHANINQTKSDNDKGTGTGRFSINDPALQQIHKRDEDIASIVRAVFVALSGHDWVCNDWAQMDFRVFAHYAKIKSILEQYAKDPDTDFHQIVSDLTGIPRKPRFAGDANSKQINLGLVFGMGQGKLAAEMGLPYTTENEVDPDTGKVKRVWLRPGEAAKEVFRNYNRAVPGIKELLENAAAVAKSRGYVNTIMGRRIRFPFGSHFKAGGLIFQGSAADALKVKIIQLDQYFEEAKGDRGYLALNVHDEFDSMVPEGRADVRADISRIVTDFESEDQPIKFRVPIKTEQGYGPDWWTACK